METKERIRIEYHPEFIDDQKIQVWNWWNYNNEWSPLFVIGIKGFIELEETMKGFKQSCPELFSEYNDVESGLNDLDCPNCGKKLLHGNDKWDNDPEAGEQV